MVQPTRFNTICCVGLACAAAAFICAGHAHAQSSQVSGTVRDSLSRSVLHAAEVQLVPVNNPAAIRATQTDASGSFQFPDVAAGDYLIGFNHVVLDSLGLDPVSFRIALAPGEARELELAIPSARTLIRSLCSADVATDSTGLFIGNVRSVAPDAGFGRAPTGLRVTWTELQFARDGLKVAHPVIEATPGPGGWFALCRVPLTTPISVRAWQGTDSTGLIELELPDHGLLRRDLLVGAATSRVDYTIERAMRTGDGTPGGFRYDTTAAVRTARGAGSLRGTVRLLSGDPVGDARVEIAGTGLATTTSSDGTFEIDSLPLGSQTVVARLLGLSPHRGVVDLLPDRVASYDIVLAPFVTNLERISVTVPGMRPLWMAGFEARRSGPGTHLDSDEIAKRNPNSLADLLKNVTGISVVQIGVFDQLILLRTNASDVCSPAVFVDGLRVSQESIPNPAFIQGVEVYQRSSLAPAEFADLSSGCGSIVIWTGQRR